jgi:hypothetical protein
MSYPINYPTPQGANIQIFREGGTTSDWVKPQGASFVWFTLIGGGGGGDGSSIGGGSSAITNFMGPAFLIPDVLTVSVGRGGGAGVNGTNSVVSYRLKATTAYDLLTVNGGTAGGAGGTISTSNYFSCMGFFQSRGGQSGSGGDVNEPGNTFLTGGGSSAGFLNSSYGYSLPVGNNSGVFQLQPIIVGMGGLGVGTGGIGCGGGRAGRGGDGLVVIITW